MNCAIKIGLIAVIMIAIACIIYINSNQNPAPAENFDQSFNYVDWTAKYYGICSKYNPPPVSSHPTLDDFKYGEKPVYPQSEQDCPDSSFTFTTDMSKLIKGAAAISGCAQLVNNTAYCYSNEEGKYLPDLKKLQNTI